MSGDDLRDLLATGAPVVMPGVWDAISARLAAKAGFSTVFVSGYAVAGTQLAVPDIGYVTQTEMADVARRIRLGVPEVLTVVDADTGFGNPLNTIRTVDLWEQAGATGLFLEDQVFPKRCGHMAGKQVIERADWLAKLRAARSHSSSLFLTARTDARAPRGLDEAIERGRAARDLGVDAVFIEAPESLDELEQIARALPDVTLVANMVETGKTPLLTGAELHELGFDLIVSPLTALFAAVKAMQDALAILAAEGSLRDHLGQLATFDGFTSLVELERHRALDAAFGGDVA